MAKIEWSKAKTDYIKDETMSYAKLAEKYGVAKRTVAERAAKENWQKLRKDTSIKVHQNLSEKVGEVIATARARHIKLGLKLQKKGGKAIRNIKPKSFEEGRKAVVSGIQIEKEALGDREGGGVVVNIKAIIANWVKGGKLGES